jgi:hypothetical protein
MNATLFNELEQSMATGGPAAVLERLCTHLREHKDYGSLFYARLMARRHELGVSPVAASLAADVPDSVQVAYEDTIRQVGRQIGQLYLEQGDLPQAWAYFRMLGEPEPIRAALERHEPGEDEDVQTLVQIAFYEGVHPQKGFDWILSRFGICSAITTLGSQELPQAEVRQFCIRAVVRALYAELRERLVAEIEGREGKRPAEAEAAPDTAGVVHRLITGRDELFADEFYHIDTSHLSSVVQMSIHLEPCLELRLARELCEYGQRLSGRFLPPGDPPFEDLYRAYGLYLAILDGDKVEDGLAYFRDQAEKADPETVGTYPAEVLVNLLLRLGKPEEALAVARKHLAAVGNRPLTCPGIVELCDRVKDYRTLTEVAREQGDPVQFVAGLLAGQKRSS